MIKIEKFEDIVKAPKQKNENDLFIVDEDEYLYQDEWVTGNKWKLSAFAQCIKLTLKYNEYEYYMTLMLGSDDWYLRRKKNE